MLIRTLLTLLTAAVLAAPLPASAFALTVSIDGLFLQNLGSCHNAPGGCTDLVDRPPGGDSNGFFDQVTLTATSIIIDSNAASPVNFVQPYIFNPGDTGAGSVGFTDFFSLDRGIHITDGINTIDAILQQTGDLTVGMFEDTLNIDASTPWVIDLTIFGLPGTTLTLTMDATSITAGIDPPGDIEGGVSLQSGAPVPAPATLLLVALGLVSGGIRQRLAARTKRA